MAGFSGGNSEFPRVFSEEDVSLASGAGTYLEMQHPDVPLKKLSWDVDVSPSADAANITFDSAAGQVYVERVYRSNPSGNSGQKTAFDIQNQSYGSKTITCRLWRMIK